MTKGRLHNDKANGKRKDWLECAAAVQFMWGAAKEGWPRNPPQNDMVVQR